jgi:hypothetical protein
LLASLFAPSRRLIHTSRFSRNPKSPFNNCNNCKILPPPPPPNSTPVPGMALLCHRPEIAPAPHPPAADQLRR